MNVDEIQIIPVESPADILPELRNTPIESLMRYHNFDESFRSYEFAEMLVGMCMDNRKQLRIPDNFAYILRAGGGNLRKNEFKVSYAIAIGGVKAIAIIGHTQCGMVGLLERKDRFIAGLVEHAGWSKEQAEEHFATHSNNYEIGNEVRFACEEAQRLGAMYPKLLVVPLLYKVEDSKLYQLKPE